MANKYIYALSRAIWDSDLIGTRITLFLGELSWAIMLFWVGDTFSRPTYAHMSMLFNEEVWGTIFLISAFTQLSIILMNDMHGKFARYFACWNASLWMYVVWSMIVSVYPPPAAIGGEIALALGAAWVWLRPYILAEGYKRAGYY